ncbi:hypothetical protein LF1_33630 [Rubripirellula obstinata]|uniref:Uncharacterized protein n=1 Tax=Rubripirellula obstinata TaxID=406547 RepID=A0A5B1CKI4_9BACT|nr:hypothetical protein [Rubripirellula obstinata]KAA1260821.1 hypothetical protein LF1_33630 [Rubripirellula obstinata]
MPLRNAASFVLVTVLIHASAAYAENRPPLYQLAGQYESAVERFEKVVLRVRGIDRTDEKWVDRLDDESARLRRAARNPRHFSKFLNEWAELKKLHSNVEARIFGKYTPNHDLVHCWSVVVYQRDLLETELFFHVENQRHGNSVRPIRVNNARRDRYLKAMSLAKQRR